MYKIQNRLIQGGGSVAARVSVGSIDRKAAVICR